MEILESGKNRYVLRCERCDCLFRYGKLEVVEKQMATNDYVDTIVCPECGKEIIIPMHHIYGDDGGPTVCLYQG